MTDRFGIPEEIYKDHRYVDIGDLPTGFAPYRDIGLSRIYLRPFCVRELSLLYTGSHVSYNGIQHILRAIDMVISCDVEVLTDGDLEYLMAWLRRSSYPKSPSLVRWICKKNNVIETEGRAFYRGPDAETLTERDMALKGLEVETCNAENNEIVHSVQMTVHTLDDDDLTIPYDNLDFPRVRTLPELHMLLEEQPEKEYEARMARWVKEGETLEEKMTLLSEMTLQDLANIEECQSRYKHGISESLNLRCRTCDNRVQHKARPNIMTFFADNSEKDLMDIQYSLLTELGLQPDDNMPSKTLLYHHSCLAKDKQEEAERARMKKAVQGG